ncbi:MAG TPA: hypothetical protein VF744_00975 [Beijerinckiaceae bacterium]|jgi:hypothetical protein
MKPSITGLALAGLYAVLSAAAIGCAASRCDATDYHGYMGLVPLYPALLVLPRPFDLLHPLIASWPGYFLVVAVILVAFYVAGALIGRIGTGLRRTVGRGFRPAPRDDPG